jgi:hypothetical protein
MKGINHPTNDETLNPSGNESILDVAERADVSRRRFIQGAASAPMLAAAGGLTLSGLTNTVQAAANTCGASTTVGIGFANLPAALAPVPDAVRVAAGHKVELLVAWGDPIMPGGVPFKGDASETAAEQAKQFGEHNDGMHYFGFNVRGAESSDRGLLVVNNEYTQESILHADGLTAANQTIAKARKSQAAHGVSVVEIRKDGAGRWGVVANSAYGRRFTANTPMRVSGPAAGHALLQSRKFDIETSASIDVGQNNGFEANGTINNCANGYTPWGTYLTCEENWNGNFGANGSLPASSTEIGKLNNRYGVTASGNGYLWHKVDPRFDVSTNPLEPNLFGWVVEIDPFDPYSLPVKRTALGRFKHESAQYVLGPNNELAVYMGDDERNEYIYKFVAAGRYNPSNRAANRNLLDTGVLYAARFLDNGQGVWLPLLPGSIGVDGVALRDNPNFAGADDNEVLAKILIKTRMAADALGATMMDRPEWTGVRPKICGFDEIEVYCTLTNNNRRGTTPVSSNQPDGSTGAGSARPAVDAVNPRADNVYGHIVRWREAGKNVTATTFAWDLFVQCGDSATTKTPASRYVGNVNDTPNGSADFGAPDGLWFDQFGRLWVQTDQAGTASGDWVNIGANCMVCADPATGAIKRFLTSPMQSEVTGIAMTPDGKSMFVGMQHPGEEAANPANPTQFSNWPASQFSTNSAGQAVVGGRPRSGVVVITKTGGGIVGS